MESHQQVFEKQIENRFSTTHLNIIATTVQAVDVCTNQFGQGTLGGSTKISNNADDEAKCHMSKNIEGNIAKPEENL